MGFCNSCGRPIVKADYGTNADGSLNDEYCKDCFQNGEFTEPDITLEEMIIRKTKEMMERSIINYPKFISLFNNMRSSVNRSMGIYSY